MLILGGGIIGKLPHKAMLEAHLAAEVMAVNRRPTKNCSAPPSTARNPIRWRRRPAPPDRIYRSTSRKRSAVASSIDPRCTASAMVLVHSVR